MLEKKGISPHILLPLAEAELEAANDLGITFHPMNDVPIIPGDFDDASGRSSPSSIRHLFTADDVISIPADVPNMDDVTNEQHEETSTLLVEPRNLETKQQLVKKTGFAEQPDTRSPTQEDKWELVPPDGGWGWAVLSGAVLVNILIPGMIKSFGVLFVEFLEVFKTSPAQAAWIPGLSYWLYCSMAPFASVLSRKFSHRMVTMVGGLLACVGLVISSFATSISYLCVSYGLIAGMGAGLGYPPSIFLVGYYFEQKRGFANGLTTSGSAMGGVIMPPLLRYLITEYSYRGAILILGALMMNVWVGAMFFQPVERHMKRVPKKVEPPDVTKTLTRNVSITSRRTSVSSGHPMGSAPIIIQYNSFKDTANQGSYNSPNYRQGETPPPDTFPRSDSFTERQWETSATPPRLDITSEELGTGIPIPKSLSAIPEDTGDETPRTADWTYYESLPAAKQKLIQLSTRGMTSNPSTSSFHYMSTIHHGSTLTVVQNVKNMPEFASTLTLRSVKNSFDCSLLDWFKNCFSRNKHLTDTKSKKKPLVGNKYFDFALLRDGVYLVMLYSTSTSAVGCTNFNILLPTYAATLGFSKEDGSLLLSTVAGFDFIGRIGGAALSDLRFIPRRFYYSFGLLISGMVLAVMPFFTKFSAVATFCAAFGLATGAYVGVTAALLADLLGPEKLGSSFGLSLFVSGILQLAGPPICGYLIEATGSFMILIIGFGVILMTGGSATFCIPIIQKHRIDKKLREAGIA